ncbi:MAG TPA: ABC transporter permease [Candidatus Cybelea sp.]|jgi:putative ABC transport system permease protein|nr:ABC transporter permease [Candidatus Cybelea sp.]
MFSFWQDIHYAGRNLRKSPGFAVVAMVTLALGIGASTAIFSVIENVLMEPFPYPDAQHFVSVQIHDTEQNRPGGRGGYSGPEYLDFVGQNHVFDRVIANAGEDVLYTYGQGTDRFSGGDVTPGTFEFLGMPALVGRVMEPADYEPGAPPVFVLRYKTWVNRFNADSAILNQTFVLNGTARTLIGVMPPRFAWGDADLWIPEKPSRADTTPQLGFNRYWFMLGHLKPGVSEREAQADFSVIAQHLSTVYPKDYPKHFTVEIHSLTDLVVGRFRTTLFIVLAAVGLLLLIGCGNVANLLLARATTREKEFAIRAALGAGRWRLVRQLLVESLILATGGAGLGALLAWGGLKSLVALIPQEIIPAEAAIRLNVPVLLFTLGVSVATALVFGLVPAFETARRDLNDPLRDSGKGVSGGFRHSRLRDAVVVLEVALSLTLLVGAGLLMRSFVALREVHLGLQPDHILVARLPLPKDRYKTADQIAGFFRPLLLRLRAMPGVVEATETSTLPPYGGIGTDVEIPGKTHSEKWTALYQLCSEGYFPVLKLQFLTGRPFTEAEVNGAKKFAVVNQTFAHKYLGEENPIGQRVRLAHLETAPDPVHDPWFEIIGVVADAKNRGLQDPSEPEVWIPYTLTGSFSRGVLVRTAGEPLSMLNAVRQEIWATDRSVALTLTGTLEGYISQFSYAGPRFGFFLLGIFATIGLVLVTIGVYSVLAYTAARRTHEIGIRMALGAESGDVLKLVLSTGLRLVILGVAIGLAASLGVARVIATQLWGVSPYDAATLTTVPLLLLVTGLVACWVPARRAARVDPLVALRYE